jgi:hypothetical protein
VRARTADLYRVKVAAKAAGEKGEFCKRLTQLIDKGLTEVVVDKLHAAFYLYQQTVCDCDLSGNSVWSVFQTNKVL